MGVLFPFFPPASLCPSRAAHHGQAAEASDNPTKRRCRCFAPEAKPAKTQESSVRQDKSEPSFVVNHRTE